MCTSCVCCFILKTFTQNSPATSEIIKFTVRPCVSSQRVTVTSVKRFITMDFITTDSAPRHVTRSNVFHQFIMFIRHHGNRKYPKIKTETGRRVRVHGNLKCKKEKPKEIYCSKKSKKQNFQIKNSTKNSYIL